MPYSCVHYILPSSTSSTSHIYAQMSLNGYISIYSCMRAQIPCLFLIKIHVIRAISAHTALINNQHELCPFHRAKLLIFLCDFIQNYCCPHCYDYIYIYNKDSGLFQIYISWYGEAFEPPQMRLRGMYIYNIYIIHTWMCSFSHIINHPTNI